MRFSWRLQSQRRIHMYHNRFFYESQSSDLSRQRRRFASFQEFRRRLVLSTAIRRIATTAIVACLLGLWMQTFFGEPYVNRGNVLARGYSSNLSASGSKFASYKSSSYDSQAPATLLFRIKS